MENKVLKPKIRFKGFTDTWEQRKLNELTNIITKGTTPLDKVNEGTINFIKIENIDSFSGNINITSKITEEEHNSYLKRSQLKENDLLFSIAGTLGRVTVVKSDVLPANTNQALAIIRLKDGDINYIKTYLKGKTISNFIKRNPTIGAQPNLSLEQVGNFDIDMPNKEEQRKLGNLFNSIDNLITLHQSKYDKLVNVKKALLEKMFPKDGKNVPEIRFKGFTDTWEQRKLGKIANIIGGGTPSTLVSKYWNGDINWYSPVEIGDKIFVSSSQKKITQLGYEKSSAKLLPIGTVLFTSRAGIGNTAILAKEGCTNQGFQSIVPNKKEIDSYFIYSMTNQLKEYGEKIGAGSTFAEVSGKQMEEMPINIPKLEEQCKISQLFEKIDNLITLHQHKLEKLKNMKKSLLNKMFI